MQQDLMVIVDQAVMKNPADAVGPICRASEVEDRDRL